MRSLFVILIASTLTTAAFSESNWSLEADGGYAFAYGDGYPHDSSAPANTLLRLNLNNTFLGNSGWQIGIRAAYNLVPNLDLVFGGSYLAGNTVFSNTVYSGTSSAQENFTAKWSSYRLMAGLRYTFLRVSSWSFFGGTGPVVLVPNDMTISQTDPFTSVSATHTVSFNAGLGAYAEVGTEYALNDSSGITLSLAFDKVSVALSKEVFSDATGNTTTVIYSGTDYTSNNTGNPQNTTYTVPAETVDLSDLSLKIGAVVHF